MKGALIRGGLGLLALLLSPPLLRAQPGAPAARFTDAQGRYQLSYPRRWQLRPAAANGPVGAGGATFLADTARQSAAGATLSLTPLPDALKERRLLGPAALDSTEQRLRQLPQAQVLGLSQRDYGAYEELRYDYTFAEAPAAGSPADAPGPGRTHVVGRQIWRGGYELRLEYRGPAGPDARYLAEGRRLVESLAFTNQLWTSRRYADQRCDDRLYGIVAMRYRDGEWLDDCRTIHEFRNSDLTARPVVHPRALPFQSYALTQGFDNRLYSVTKSPTDRPELVYCYDPAARQGHYTTWQLPAQGPDNIWISAATDERGDLYFLTSDANTLVKVSPPTGRVTVLWASDPLRRTPFYPAIAFTGAGTHGNFCLDDQGTLYLVYSTTGALLRVDLRTRRPAPDMLPVGGLPARGGYSDLLLQADAAGRRFFFLAGSQAVYKVDLVGQQATRVRKGTYTDLAGCNLFRLPPPSRPAPPPPATATWRGRVLDAATGQPLPQAALRLQAAAGTDQALALSAEGAFTVAALPGRVLHYRAQLAGYLSADTTYTTGAGLQTQDVVLRRLRVGATQRLDNVQFAQGQATLLPASFPALDQLLALLTDNPGLTIELRGHTDNVGDAAQNQALSEQRVAAVKAYLVGHGIAGARLTGRGFGGSQPAASNEQESTRRLNRRVEFRVTGTP